MCVCVFASVCVCVHFNMEPIHDFHETVSTVSTVRRRKKPQPLLFNFLESVKKHGARAYNCKAGVTLGSRTAET